MFETNENTQAPKKQAKADTSNQQKKKEQASTPVPSARRVFAPTTSKKGRAIEYAGKVKEALESVGDNTTIILTPDNELSRILSSEYGFVIHANRVGADLMWHLQVFESTVTPVARHEAKQHRRSREDKVFTHESTCDAITDDLVADIQDWILDNVEVSGEIYFSNVTVISVEADITDPNYVNMLACDAEDANILFAGIDEPFSANKLDENSTLRAKLTFVPNEDAVTLGGMPLRSDIQIAVTESFREESVSQIRASSGSRTILELDAYTNLRWIGNERPDRNGDFDPAAYVVEVVMSQFNPYHEDVKSGNFERFALGLASMLYLKDGDLWQTPFESNMHNPHGKLSGLAYGMFWPNDEIPTDIDLVDASPSEGTNWLHKVIYHDNQGRNVPVEFAVLINEGAVGYATQSILIDIATGGNAADIAIDKLNATFSNLTDNQFPMGTIKSVSDVISGQVRVPVGYYNTSDGKRPIEEIDTLYVLNALKDNYPEHLADYLEIMQIDERDFDHDEAMSKLITIYNLVTDGQYVLKGFGTKVYLNPELLEDLAEAIASRDSGLGMVLDCTVDNGSRGRRSRGGRRTSAGLTSSPLSHERARSSNSRMGRLTPRYRN